jgi:hypothetical protein
MQVGCRVSETGFFLAEAEGNWQVSGTAAQGSSDVYVWLLYRWVCVYHRHGYVS